MHSQWWMESLVPISTLQKSLIWELGYLVLYNHCQMQDLWSQSTCMTKFVTSHSKVLRMVFPGWMTFTLSLSHTHTHILGCPDLMMALLFIPDYCNCIQFVLCLFHRLNDLLLLSSSPLIVALTADLSVGRNIQSRFSAVAAPVEEKTGPASHSPVQEAHGFKLERHQFIKEYDSMVALYKHQKSGKLFPCSLNIDIIKSWILLNSDLASQATFWMYNRDFLCTDTRKEVIDGIML